MKSYKFSTVAAIVALLPFSSAYAETENKIPKQTFSERQWKELIVMGSYQPKPAREVGSAVTVITNEEIDQQKTLVASDLLREVPGIAVNRIGPAGTLTQVRIRGAEDNHTQVFIDGIEANDPLWQRI